MTEWRAGDLASTNWGSVAGAETHRTRTEIVKALPLDALRTLGRG